MASGRPRGAGVSSLDRLRLPAELAGCDAKSVADWLDRDPKFVMGLNRAKTYRRERLRAEILALTNRTVKTLRQLVSDSGVPSVVPSCGRRTGAGKIGSASDMEVEVSWSDRDLLESLTNPFVD